MSESTPRPPRRPRYAGKNPRRFTEKYKEHQPGRYVEEVGKIIASGKTPAGMHRPILVQEILEVLAPKPGDVAVDGTLGYGGHATELLKAILPGGMLIALDADPIELPRTVQRMREAGFGEDVLKAHRSNFAGLRQVLAAEGVTGADVLLADLGLSSMQIDNPARGFTFKEEGPLDLRINPQRGQPAWEFLSRLTEPQLRDLLIENADEPHAARLAPAIATAHARRPLRTTTDLARTIREALGVTTRSKVTEEVTTAIRRVFQALRIAVNDEFGALDTFLTHLPACLKPGGRAAILTFHSGEDRRVKKAFQAGARAGTYARIAGEVVRPTPEEQRANPRSTAAKLRWAVRAEGG